ncbi:hypothetical protein RvY_12040-2 [Ramazzottius varieornatus]|uniref:G-protein coupled receptors family 1 profile domain-containing protein n=1 Tax=Ramazzottius varieornatus TaxID=947166 RepID=A0A1D1VKH6_RAMVA|nr:hypothetical protein RvY_12040-2 [Ramazzottius varieornatus]
MEMSVPLTDSYTNGTVLSAGSKNVIGWLIPCIFFHLISTGANLSLVIAVCADRTCKPGAKLLIGHMAIIAFIFTAVFQPLHTYRTITGYDHFRNSTIRESSYRCDWTYKMHLGVLTAVGWSEVSLAINRAVAIGLPHLYPKFRDTRVSLTFMLATWSIAGVLVALSAAGVKVMFLPTAHGTCILSPASSQPLPFGTLPIFAMHTVPYLVSVVITLMVFLTAYLKIRTNRSSTQPSASLDRLLQKRLVIARAIFVSALWCFVCLLPKSIILARLSMSTPPSLLFDWLRALTVFQYAVNPVSVLCLTTYQVFQYDLSVFGG